VSGQRRGDGRSAARPRKQGHASRSRQATLPGTPRRAKARPWTFRGAASANDVLQPWRDADVLGSLDVHFARELERMKPGQPRGVLLAAAFASRAVGVGHVCADLRRLVARPPCDPDGHAVPHPLPSLFEWVMDLGQSELCGNGHSLTPLVFDGEARVYLRRYWQYQNRIAEDLTARHRALVDVDSDDLRPRVARLFGAASGQRADSGQTLAAVSVALRRLAVISGGPGTGKTTTVVRILALLIEQAFESGREAPRILMLAPTGKAAARLAEAVASGRDRLPCDDRVRAAIPTEASTIHRQLGFRPAHPTRFFHDRENPLAADVVLIDEASMVDLALMAKVLDAVPAHARLVLLGDKDQLASVEAGTILGDICGAARNQPYSQAFVDGVVKVAGSDIGAGLRTEGVDSSLRDCVVELTRSFRFESDRGIGPLATAIRHGDRVKVSEHLRGLDDRIALHELTLPSQLTARLVPAVLEAFRAYFEAQDPLVRLAALNRYRLLAAHRRGMFGTEHLNLLIESALAARGYVGTSRWAHLGYDGRPILVTQNDYQLELFNGDVGVIHDDGAHGLRAYFAGRDGELRSFPPARLPPHESLYAMTVHKSQGSEFDEVGLLMPPQLSPILTRELVYTGVTRARQRVTVYGNEPVLMEALERRIDRASGLTEALHMGRGPKPSSGE